MKPVLAVVAMFVLTAGSCESDEDAESTSDGTVVVADASAGASEDDSSGGESSTPTGSSSDFQTVWPVPPFGSATVDPGFGAYSIIDDEYRHTEDVTFELTGTDQDSVVAFYQEILVKMGYEVDPPLELGASIALNVSMAGNEKLSAVVQIGPKSPNDPTIIVHQERTDLKDQAEESEDLDDSGSSSSDDE